MRGQEGNGFGDFLWLGHASHGGAAYYASGIDGALAFELPDQGGGDIPRGDGVHPNAGACPLAGHGACHAQYAGLGRTVGIACGQADGAGNRAEVDDGAALPVRVARGLQHVPGNRLAHQKGAA